LLSTLHGSLNASARFYMMKGSCGKRRLKGNLELILRAAMLNWWIETRTAEPFFRDKTKWNSGFSD